MFSYYELNLLPIILECFEVNNIIICGTGDKETLRLICSYCGDYHATYTTIASDEMSLNKLSNLYNYDAIFINDDPNWYTVYNELKCIKDNNESFPLVFICNNIFPYAQRDYYICPDNIPSDFRNEHSKKIEYGCINFSDGLYKSISNNISKNGVLTAIEDFLKENKLINFINFKLSNGITILYFNDEINRNRLLNLSKIMKKYVMGHNSNFFESTSYNDVVDVMGDTDSMGNLNINTSENQNDESILYDDEISYKNSQINNFNSKLSLKDAQLMNVESKLFNRENEIKKLNEKLFSLKKEFEYKEDSLNSKLDEIKEQLNVAENIIGNEQNINSYKENQLENKQIELNSLKQKYIKQISRLDNKEYCISCFREEISNNQFEIQYLKKTSILKKILSPFGYIFLIFKSNPNEIRLNLKLYSALKDSKCFDIGYYLNKNEDVRDSNWCKYFSPELHYICNGFDENRKFNKKYFNRNSKKELLEYILKCNY